MERVIAYTKSSYTIGTIFLIGILTALSGELKVTPFDEMSLRFGFGSIVFFIAILIRPVPILYTGIITGIIVWLFRTLLNTIQLSTLQLTENLPAMVFYIVFALGLSLLNVNRWRSRPFILGIIGAGLELVANFIELILHMYLLNEFLLSSKEYMALLLVAMIRSFFVVGIYSTVVVSEQKKLTAQLLNIHSNLYVEALYIEKMMQNIEEVTAKSFALYRTLQENSEPSNVEALNIAQSIHEIKKDAQRINAGLSKITQGPLKGTYEIAELLEFVVEANKRYSLSQQKDIDMYVHLKDSFTVKQHYLLLALMNNIVSNAVEAIQGEGTISLHVQKQENKIRISIRNSGPPIDEAMVEVIFEPGFTTKFSEYGQASTGIGLSHVKAIMEQLEGEIQVNSAPKTEFIITIPLENI